MYKSNIGSVFDCDSMKSIKKKLTYLVFYIPIETLTSRLEIKIVLEHAKDSESRLQYPKAQRWIEIQPSLISYAMKFSDGSNSDEAKLKTDSTLEFSCKVGSRVPEVSHKENKLDYC